MTTKAKKTKNAKASAKAVNAKAETAAAVKKTSQLDAAAAVLAKAAEPMSCKAMVDAMVAAKLWESPKGKTPEATLYSAILREIAAKGEQARFVKTERGRFAVRG